MKVRDRSTFLVFSCGRAPRRDSVLGAWSPTRCFILVGSMRWPPEVTRPPQTRNALHTPPPHPSPSPPPHTLLFGHVLQEVIPGEVCVLEVAPRAGARAGSSRAVGAAAGQGFLRLIQGSPERSYCEGGSSTRGAARGDLHEQPQRVPTAFRVYRAANRPRAYRSLFLLPEAVIV